MMLMQRKRLKADLTPLIDCIFLLLVFFMVTTVMNDRRTILQVALPPMDGAPAVIEQKSLYVEVRKNELAVDGVKLNMEEFASLVAQRANSQPPVQLAVDSETTYSQLAKILDILRQNQLTELELLHSEVAGPP